MKRKTIALALAVCMTLSLCACDSAEPEPTPTPESTPTEEPYTPVSFKNNGKRTIVYSLPKKIVTAGPNCTETLCALGLEDSVIGKCMENHSQGALEQYAEAVAGIPTLSVGYPTAQQIIDSGCDFLYATDWMFGDDLTVEQLEAAGIIVYISEATDFDSLLREMRDLCKVFLLDPAVEVSELSTRLESLEASLDSEAEPKSVLVLDSFVGGMVYTAGGTNIETACIAAAGGANAFAELEKAWDAVETSAVAQADPYCIIIHDYEGSDYDSKVAALKADPVLSQLDAVQSERFLRITLEDAMPGIRSVGTAETIAAFLSGLE